MKYTPGVNAVNMTFEVDCPKCGTRLTGEHCVNLQSLRSTAVCQCGADVEIPVSLSFTDDGRPFFAEGGRPFVLPRNHRS
jgi:transcription elongation factor Elf1